MRPKSESEVKPMSDDEVKDLARALLKHEVFMSDCVTESRDLPLVFMTINFLTQEQIDGLKARDVVHLWEHMCESAPRSFNGYPTFFSHHEITRSDHVKVRAEWRRLKAAIGEPVPETTAETESTP